MPSRTPLRRCVPLLLLVSAVLGLACSGGSSSTPTPAAPPAIGATGGTVTEPGGASVVVPPGALTGDVTIRIAKDSTGAPALPTGLASAGATYVITPHGGDFAEPVEVRIPAPGVTLQPNQELKLAKAQPGGEWEVLADSTLKDGVLTTRVRSFSWFVPVTISYVLPLVQWVPWEVVTQLTCNGQPCKEAAVAVGIVTATFSWTTNGGQLPGACTSANSQIDVDERGSVPGSEPRQSFPVAGGSVTRTLLPTWNPWHQFEFFLRCGSNFYYSAFTSFMWLLTPYPSTDVLRMPASLDVVEGRGASVDAVLSGGASQRILEAWEAPTPTNRAVIDWQRSDDDGASWRPIARSFQDEANPDPLGVGFDWMYWGVHHGFIASAADQGALVRVYACYTPPDVPAPPCVTGPATRLNVVQQGTAPTITTQPASLNVVAGSDAAFAVAAQGTGTLGYQWSHDGTPIAGATGPVLRLSAVTAGSAGAYGVVVSNVGGSAASDAAILTVSTGAPAPVAPVIVTQPAAVLVHAGDTATFAVGVSGSGPLTFTWRKDGAPVAGATSAALTLAGVAAGDAGSYSVMVTNGAGTVTSADAALVVSTTPPPVLTPPSITTQPSTLVVVPGGAATLAVAASGGGPLTYQWWHDGAPVVGATEAVLLLDGVGPLHAGSYTVTIVNDAGTATSNPAQLILVGAPSITVQPADTTAVEGNTAVFTVAATGSALRYQWERNGSVIAGATGAAYTTPALTVGDHGATFTVLVYNAAGLVLSRAARLTVNGLTPPGMALFVGNFVLGGGGGAADATGLDARLDTPDGLVADSAGNLYVAEANIPMVAKVSPGGVVTTLLQHPNFITSLALGPDGSLYVGAACGMPRLLPPLVAGAVNQPVQTGSCVVGQVRGVAVGDAGEVLVSLPSGNAIYQWVGGAAGYSVFAGAPNVYLSPGSSDGNGTAARFNAQQGMVRAVDGTLYVADTGNQTIRKVTPAGDVTTWIGAPGIPGTVDGIGSAARLYRPTQLAFDAVGNLFVLTMGDPAAPEAMVRRITPAGEVTTLFNATAEVLAIATAAEAPWASNIRGLAVIGTNRVALSAGNAIVVRTLR